MSINKSWFYLVSHLLTRYGTGLLVFVLGLTVMLGWYTNNATFIQVLPQFVPMQYNTALGFLLAGLGLLSSHFYPRFSQCIGVLIVFIGLLTLIEYVFFIDLRIDELLMEHYITVQTSHPGRMAPNTALCFLLTGACLFLQHITFKQKIVIIISFFMALMISILSIIALFGYITKVPTTYGWGQLTRMAVHTALGFMLISFSLIPALWYKTHLASSKSIIILPSMIFLSGSILFISLGYAISIFLFENTKNEVQKQAQSIVYLMKTEISNHIKSIERLFSRAKINSYVSFHVWQSDTKHYLKDLPSTISISVLKKHGVLIPAILKNNAISMREIKALNHLCENQSSYSNNQSTKPFTLLYGKNKNNYLCVYDQSSHIAALLSLNALIENVFDKQASNESDIILRSNDKNIYTSENIATTYVPPFTASAPFQIKNIHWTLTLLPHEAFLDSQTSSIPLIFVWVGLFTTLLLSISVRYWQYAKIKTLEAQDNATKIAYLAYHDPLTGLLNRTQYEQKIDSSIARCKRYNRHMAILFIDLDRFKHINDSYGHDIGDSFLIKVATILKNVARPDNAVCRIGGDEFGIVLDEITQMEEPGILANKIIDAFTLEIKMDLKHVGVTSSIGIATYPKAGEDRLTLIKHADIALYHAKGSGKNTFRYFSDELDVRTKYRFKIESLLFPALTKNEFYLVYQPIIHLHTKETIGFEALIRWQSPSLGLVMPDDFIPIAEETHIIIDMGRWVFQEALRTFSIYYKKHPHLKLNINLSPQQLLNDNWFEFSKDLLNMYSVPPQAIVFELTETDVITDFETMQNKLLDLIQYGFHIYIDDFGTGYTSLQFIRKLPISGLKIDKGFVSDLNNQDKEGKMLRSIIAIANLHDLVIIVEGIETKAQFDFVRQFKCQYTQGYYFSKPVLKKDIDALL